MAAPAPCIKDESDIVYVDGLISFSQTMKNCLDHVADPLLIPTFYNNTFNGIILVNSSLQLNNLHFIDPVAGEVTLDFYLRLYWYDNRLAMPLFWNKMSKSVQANGIELTALVADPEDTGVDIWKPDVRFHDASAVDYIVETIRINASNVVFWSRHTKITLIQPKQDFRLFPEDTQSVDIRFGSYAYSNAYFKMNYYGNELSFNTNYDGSYTFLSNPTWSWNSKGTSFGLYTSGSNFVNCIYHISVTRQSLGAMNRITVPILYFMLFVGLTYWVNPEHRLDICVGILLAVSALYIVVLANIPLVGYLTTVDSYVFYAFLIILLAAAFHVMYCTLNDKKDMWPLRVLYLRLIEFSGRVFLMPFLLIFFAYSVAGVTPQNKLLMFVGAIVSGGIILIRETPGLRSALVNSIKKVDEKFARHGASGRLSLLEKLVVNLYRVGKFSLDVTEHVLHINNKHTHHDDHLAEIAMRETARPLAHTNVRHHAVASDVENLADISIDNHKEDHYQEYFEDGYA